MGRLPQMAGGPHPDRGSGGRRRRRSPRVRVRLPRRDRGVGARQGARPRGVRAGPRTGGRRDARRGEAACGPHAGRDGSRRLRPVGTRSHGPRIRGRRDRQEALLPHGPGRQEGRIVVGLDVRRRHLSRRPRLHPIRRGGHAGPQDEGHRPRHLPRFPAQPRDVRRSEGPPHRQRPSPGLRPARLGAHDEHVLRRGPRQEGRDRRGDEVRRADAQMDQRDGRSGRRVVPGRHTIGLPDREGRGRRARSRHDPDRRRVVDLEERRPGLEGDRPRRRDMRERRGGLRARGRRRTVHALQDRRRGRLTSTPSTSPRTRCGGRRPPGRAPPEPMRSPSPPGPPTTTTASSTDAARRSKPPSVPKAITRIRESAFRVANSNGILANHRGTLVFAYLTAKCGSKGKFGEGILKAMNTSTRPIDFAAHGATVARRAAENLRARAFKGKLPGVAVLDPLDLGEVFLTTVGSAVNGEDVHKGRSPWAGKVGADVASAGVTVRDRPRMPGGLASGVADDEGNATQDRTLLEAGRLKGFFADRKHAALLGVPAGNGYRRAVATVEGAYTRPAETEPSNLVVEPGRKSLEALLAEVDSGVYVEKFAAPEVNPLSGSFAMEVRNATLIKKGELADHVKVALLTGNFYDGLKNVVGVGRDLAPSHGFLTAPGCSYVPPMAFDGFELVGQA